MNERAALYPRVSTDTQRDNYSIPSQISDCLKYAEKKGYAIVGDMYVDPKTGQDTIKKNGAIPAYVDDFTSRELNRPGLNAALEYLERVGFDVLVVHALDRLARDPYIRQTLEREFNSRGARIEYVLGSYEETPEGEVRKDLDATFAKWENAKRVERCNRGKRRKAETGKFVAGRAPYGYRLDPEAF
jgi:site-specific DNA recombinase